MLNFCTQKTCYNHEALDMNFKIYLICIYRLLILTFLKVKQSFSFSSFRSKSYKALHCGKCAGNGIITYKYLQLLEYMSMTRMCSNNTNACAHFLKGIVSLMSFICCKSINFNMFNLYGFQCKK